MYNCVSGFVTFFMNNCVDLDLDFPSCFPIQLWISGFVMFSVLYSRYIFLEFFSCFFVLSSDLIFFFVGG